MHKMRPSIQTYASPLRTRLGKAWLHGDRLWQVVLIAMSLLVIGLVAALGVMLWRDSAAARTAYGAGFIQPTSEVTWNPVTDEYQAWPFIYGTLITSLVAIALALPVSLGVAVFLAELCPGWLRQPLSWLLELLAAIPSVIYGLWGIFVVLPGVIAPLGSLLVNTLGAVPGLNTFFNGPIPLSGASRLAAGMILSVMIIPTIASVTRDVLLAVPDSQREASLALGATRWESIWKVVLPYGLSGILGASIMGLGRALGETMAVTMVIGNSIDGSVSLLRPGYTMSSIIANQFAEAVSALHSSALIEIGLVLFVITLVLNSLARLLVWRVARRAPSEARS